MLDCRATVKRRFRAVSMTLCLAFTAMMLAGDRLVLAAGFDCTKKLTLVEGLICDDAELSRADGALAGAYAAAAKTLDPQQRAELRREQREWLARRDAACKLGDFESEANRIAGQRCILSYTTQRTEALRDIGAHGLRPATKEAREAGAATYHGRERSTDTLSLKPRADGTVDLSIVSDSPRGVCGVSLTGKREAGDRFVFRDEDSGCTVTVVLARGTAKVGSTGDCSGFCGVHADFAGTYVRGDAPGTGE